MQQVVGRWAILVVGLAAVIVAEPAVAQRRFADESWRLSFPDIGTRWPSWVDIDNDGWLEILIGGDRSHGLLVRTPAGMYVDVGRQAGLPTNRYTMVAGDINNDGLIDIFAPGFMERPALLQAWQGRFVDVTDERGVLIDTPNDRTFVTGATFADVDLDGDLDLFTGNERGRDTFFRNDGTGQFTDVTARIGLDREAGVRYAAFGDFDNDGDPDLFTASSRRSDIPVRLHDVPSALYVNDGFGLFVDGTAESNIRHSPRDVSGLAWLDTDNDGWLDLFFTSASGEEPMLFHNNGDLTFNDVSAAAGLTGWNTSGSAAFGDFDDDGWVDIVVASFAGPVSRNLLFRNDTDGTFTETGSSWGITTSRSGSAASGDFDRDGHLDLLLADFSGPDVLLRNLAGNGHWLQVRLVGTTSAHDAVGTRVHVQSAGRSMWREVTAGNGYGNDAPWLHFGLGATARVDSLEVRWPSGLVSRWADLAGDRILTLVEGDLLPRESGVLTWRAASTDTVVAGTEVRLDRVLRLPASWVGLASGWADLSALGGPDAVPLIAENQNLRFHASWRARADNGLAAIRVVVQPPSSGDQVSLYLPVAVLPAEPLAFYQDGLADWALTVPSAVAVDPGFRSAGGVALRLAWPGGRLPLWAATFRADDAVPVFGFESLRFRINLANADVRSRTFKVSMLPGSFSVDLVAQGLVDLDADDWQTVDVPLPALDRSVNSLLLQWGLAGEILLDDLVLVPRSAPAITTVVRAAVEPVAQTTLGAGFPNPFNASTTIPYQVTVTGQVSLTVFDMLGRRVRSLVNRAVAAGAHHARWDGLDDAGRRAGSGMYITRLQTGTLQQTGKILLLR